MKVSPILEISFVMVGMWLTIPALYQEYNQEFSPGDWETWMKLSPHIVFTFAVSFGMIGHLKNSTPLLDTAWAQCIVGLICTYFLMMFNTRSASQVICDDWESVCLDDYSGSCDTDLSAWQGFLYIAGLCLLIIGGSLAILFFIERSTGLKKVHVEEIAKE